MKRINVFLHDDDHRLLKLSCAEDGTTIQKRVNELIAIFIVGRTYGEVRGQGVAYTAPGGSISLKGKTPGEVLSLVRKKQDEENKQS